MPVHSWLANPRETRVTLDRHGLQTKHRLGQNFLVNDAVIGKILDLAELRDDDVVLEVGPGIGTLTVALRVSPAQLVDAAQALQVEGLDPEPTKLVSNLPYQVAATVVLRTFEQMPSVGRVVVMVQAEVADRMAATTGTKAYGAYTAKLSLYANVTGRFEVGPGNFMPPPHVDSAVIRLDRAPATDPATGAVLDAEQIGWCCEVIDAAFAQRRKTIRNSMSSNGFDRDELDAAYEATGIDGRTRAEALAPADFVRLAGALGWR